MPRTIETLEKELDDARARCLQAESDGAELAQRYERLVASKDADITRLKKDKRGAVIDCAHCDRLRLILTVTATVLMMSWWNAINMDKNVDRHTKAIFLLQITFPALWWWFAKELRAFKRQVAWKGFFDNDIYRKIQASWNGALDRFHLG